MILPQESVLEKELTKTKSIRAKGKEIPSKKTSQSKGNPKGDPKGKRGKSTQSDKKGKVSKNVVSSGKTAGENTSKSRKKNTGKSGSKGKKQRRQEWRQSKEGPNVTFTDVERLFMKAHERSK